MRYLRYIVGLTGFGPDRRRDPRATGAHGPAGDGESCAECSRTRGTAVAWPCTYALPHTPSQDGPAS